jgi:hypothetical protein
MGRTGTKLMKLVNQTGKFCVYALTMQFLSAHFRLCWRVLAATAAVAASALLPVLALKALSLF